MDDFGLHAGINGAAFHLAALGRISAVGCLVGGVAWRAGIGALKQLDENRIDIGLHLDLTELPGLTWAKRGLAALIAASVSRTLNRPAVRAEIRAQLDAFERGMGRAPAFVDGHRHVHQLPGVRDELVDELERRSGSNRPWLRSTCGPRAPATQGMGWRETAKTLVIEALGAQPLGALAHRHGFAQNRRLLGVYGFQGGPQRYRELLVAWVRTARDSDLLMCHPSLWMDTDDPIIGARTAEYEVLASVEFGTMLREANVHLGSIGRMPG